MTFTSSGPGLNNGQDDVLASGPPRPALRTAKKSAIARHGSAANNDGGSRLLSVMGAHPAAVVANAMATIEQQVKVMRKAGAIKTAAILESVIGSMRSVGAGELGDLAQGNPPDSGDSPPPDTPLGAPAPGAGGGGGGAMMMPPPPSPAPNLAMVPFGK